LTGSGSTSTSAATTAPAASCARLTPAPNAAANAHPVAKATTAKAAVPWTDFGEPGQRVVPTFRPTSAAAASPVCCIARATAARAAGKNTTPSAAATHIIVAPLKTMRPPKGGISSGRMSGAKSRCSHSRATATRWRLQSPRSARTASGTRTHSETSRPKKRIPAGMTSASRCSAFRRTSAG